MIVDDVTRLNPIGVAEVVTPRTLEEIVEVVRTRPGPLSVGGGRYSMGGQTACAGGVQIDMRAFNRILAFSKEEKRITVEAGCRWRDIQEHIEPPRPLGQDHHLPGARSHAERAAPLHEGPR